MGDEGDAGVMGVESEGENGVEGEDAYTLLGERGRVLHSQSEKE